MLPILQLGPLALPLPPLLLLLGFWLGLELTEKHALRFQVNPDTLYNLTLITLISGIIGARLVYAARYPSAFAANPLALLTPRPQMFDTQGGLLAALLAALIYGQRKHLALWPTLDALTTLFAVIGIALGLAHIASGDAFGAPTTVPWGIELWGERRQPTQFYETVAAVLIAAAVWPGSMIIRKQGRLLLWEKQAGLRFWIFLALNAAARMFLEAFRGDSVLLLERVRMTQVIAWFVLAVSLWQVGKRLGRIPVQEGEHVS